MIVSPALNGDPSMYTVRDLLHKNHSPHISYSLQQTLKQLTPYQKEAINAYHVASTEGAPREVRHTLKWQLDRAMRYKEEERDEIIARLGWLEESGKLQSESPLMAAKAVFGQVKFMYGFTAAMLTLPTRPDDPTSIGQCALAGLRCTGTFDHPVKYVILNKLIYPFAFQAAMILLMKSYTSGAIHAIERDTRALWYQFFGEPKPAAKDGKDGKKDPADAKAMAGKRE